MNSRPFICGPGAIYGVTGQLHHIALSHAMLINPKRAKWCSPALIVECQVLVTTALLTTITINIVNIQHIQDTKILQCRWKSITCLVETTTTTAHIKISNTSIKSVSTQTELAMHSADTSTRILHAKTCLPATSPTTILGSGGLEMSTCRQWTSPDTFQKPRGSIGNASQTSRELLSKTNFKRKTPLFLRRLCHY
jgi:hypothetical protein